MKEKTHSENVAELFRANLDASVDIDHERIAADLAARQRVREFRFKAPPIQSVVDKVAERFVKQIKGSP